MAAILLVQHEFADRYEIWRIKGQLWDPFGWEEDHRDGEQLSMSVIMVFTNIYFDLEYSNRVPRSDFAGCYASFHPLARRCLPSLRYLSKVNLQVNHKNRNRHSSSHNSFTGPSTFRPDLF